jgi:hypothetical protein
MEEGWSGEGRDVDLTVLIFVSEVLAPNLGHVIIVIVLV